MLVEWSAVCAVRHRCLEFDDGKRFLSADLNIDCDSRRYRTMFSYSIVMIVLIPIGFPLGFFWALWQHRRGLYPMNRGRCLRVQHSPDGATPCIVACVEAQFSPAAREVLHRKVQRLGQLLQLEAEVSSRGRRRGCPAAGGIATPAPPTGGVGAAWDPMPGPGNPSLQHDGASMFHYALPPTNTPTKVAAVDAMVDAWHLAPSRYDVAADVGARLADPSVRHLAFLYEVRFPSSLPCVGVAHIRGWHNAWVFRTL
jgi:hypothetical protein